MKKPDRNHSGRSVGTVINEAALRIKSILNNIYFEGATNEGYSYRHVANTVLFMIMIIHHTSMLHLHCPIRQRQFRL
jgi:hypothetical protein